MYIHSINHYLSAIFLFGVLAGSSANAKAMDPDDLTGVYEADLICILDRTSKGDMSQEAYVTETVIDHDLSTGVIKVSYFGLEWEGLMNARRDNNTSGGIRQCPSEANQREVIVLRPHYRDDGEVTIHHTSSLFGASVVVGADQIAGTCFGTFVRISKDLGDRPTPPGCVSEEDEHKQCIKTAKSKCIEHKEHQCKYLKGYERKHCMQKVEKQCLREAKKICKNKNH